MYCTNCGSYNPDNAGKCATCGVALMQSDLSTYMPETAIASNAPKSGAGKGLGITSLILGIASLVFFCMPYFAVFFAVAGVILGAIGMKKAKDAGEKSVISIIGLILSGVGTAIAVIYLFILLIALIGGSLS